MKQPEPYLAHIVEAIETISQYIKGSTYESFVKDHKTQDAVIRQLEIIGEASSKLEKTFIQSHPTIPWRDIKAFRNKLIHDYWELDTKLIWNVATKEITPLKKELLKLLNQ